MKAKLKKDPRVDQYIEEAAPFAQPILKQLRKIVEEACPEATETIKWDSPFYTYNGKILCGMGTFKEHCKFWIKNWTALNQEQGEANQPTMEKLLHIYSTKDLPSSKLLKSLLKASMKLHDLGVKPLRKPVRKKPQLKSPSDLLLALKQNRKALANYETFSESNKRHYAEWITDAKTEETREKRLEKAVDCIALGKTRHWL